MRVSTRIMELNGVEVDFVRAVDHELAPGVWPDILVLGSPIWLGEKSSVCTRVIERLYACSSLLNEHGQYAYYGKVGGCNTTCMTWNLLHLARMLKDGGGVPAPREPAVGLGRRLSLRLRHPTTASHATEYVPDDPCERAQVLRWMFVEQGRAVHGSSSASIRRGVVPREAARG